MLGLNFWLALQVAGISGTVSAVVAFLFKRAIDHAADRNLERYKTELKAAADLQLESHKAGLRQIADAYSARVSVLYQRRLDVIADGYALLPTIIRALDNYANPVRIYLPGVDPKDGDKKLLDDLKEAYAAYDPFFEKNRLFFDENTLSKIDQFDSLVQDTLKNFTRRGNTVEEQQKWEQLHKRVRELGPRLTDDLRKEFARLIGID